MDSRARKTMRNRLKVSFAYSQKITGHPGKSHFTFFTRKVNAVISLKEDKPSPVVE